MKSAIRIQQSAIRLNSAIRIQQSAIRKLPIVDGVGPSSQWLPPGSWKTVLEFLQEKFPRVELETWTRRMNRGEVVDESGVSVDPASPYREGACIYYYRELENEPQIPFDETVLYEDDHILVADKPHFLPVIPAGRFLRETLLARLRRQGKPESLIPLHRLDRETAGVMLFSVNRHTRGRYTSLFRERKIIKVYEALAPAIESPLELPIPHTRRSRIVKGEPFFRMQEVEGEPNSETRVELIDKNRYRLFPLTGKKHQLRVHLAALGIPILNDRLYPDYIMGPDDFSQPLKLLARSIAFKDPVSGRQRYFESNRLL